MHALFFIRKLSGTPKALLCGALLTLFLGACTTGKRDLASESLGRARAAVYSLSEKNKLVVLGISQKGLIAPNYYSDFTQVKDFKGDGFEGDGIQQLDPKFILLK